VATSGAIFSGLIDREHLLSLLSELPERFGTLIRAYVLMANHFHLLVSKKSKNLALLIGLCVTSIPLNQMP